MGTNILIAAQLKVILIFHVDRVRMPAKCFDEAAQQILFDAIN